MNMRSAMILQAPGIHRAMTAFSLRRLGYDPVLEVSDDTQALTHLREAEDMTLLVCDLRRGNAARMGVLQTAAREQSVTKMLVIGEPFPGAWPTLSKLIDLHGVLARQLADDCITQHRLLDVLRSFDEEVPASPAMPIVAELPCASDAVSALANDEIRAALQPKVCISTGEIYGFEVLARWQRSDGVIVSPYGFLPALREHGLLDSLLFKLMAQAARYLQASFCSHLELSVNLEPAQLAQPGFATRVHQQLVHLDLPPQLVTFELTEVGVLETPAVSLDNLLQLRALGCGLAIDDFGNGHSTLQRLLELPFTELKLDASFLSQLEDPRRHAVIANALALGRALNIPVVAEGVETVEQLKVLKNLGCERAQGFYLGRPIMESAQSHALESLRCECQQRRVG